MNLHFALGALLLGACAPTGADTPCKPQTGPSDAGGPGFGYPSEALPTGSCVGTASCQMTIVVPCDSGAPLYNGYECACTNGTWFCVDKYPDTAVCVSHPADSGVADSGSADSANDAADSANDASTD
jgi:hypothetical protein